MATNMIKNKIEQKLTEAFQPVHLEVMNESYMHNVPEGSESHFKVIVVSDAFLDKRLIACHREINQVLADELANDIHALAIHTHTPKQWESAQIPESPNCLGGSLGDEHVAEKINKNS